MKTLLYIYICFMLVFANFKLCNADNDQDIDYKKINPVTGIFDNSLQSLTGSNLYYHLGGIAAAGLIIYSGIDYKVHNYFVQNNGFDKYSNFAVSVGNDMPIILSAIIPAYGIIFKSSKEYAAGCAAIQASIS